MHARNWVLIRRMTELAAFIHGKIVVLPVFHFYTAKVDLPFNFTAIEFKFLELLVVLLFEEQ